MLSHFFPPLCSPYCEAGVGETGGHEAFSGSHRPPIYLLSLWFFCCWVFFGFFKSAADSACEVSKSKVVYPTTIVCL